MKKKTKILNKLLILSIFLLLFSCTEEKNYLENNNRELKFTQKPFKEMILLKDFNNAFQKVKSEKQKSFVARSAIEDQYDFTIVEEKGVNILEGIDKTYYNILIKRDTTSSLFFENLLIVNEKINNVDHVSAFIIKYETPNGETKYLPENDKDVSTLFSRFSGDCMIVCTSICYVGDEGGHACYGGDCVASGMECSVYCPPSFNATGGTPMYSGSGENSGNGGGGGSPNNNSGENQESNPTNENGASASSPMSLELAPVSEEEETTPKRNPCQELNAMVNKPIANVTPAKTVLTNLNDLKNNVTTNKERMYVMSPTLNNDGSVNHDLYTENYAESTENQDNVSADFGGIIIDIMVHTHWDATNHCSIFSLEDIYQIYKKIGSGQINLENKDHFTAMLITALGTQYAIKFSNINDFVTWGDEYFIGWGYSNQALREQYQDAKEDKFHKDTKIKTGNTPEIKAANDLGWASFIQTNNMGVELYRVNDTFTQFTKLSTKLLGGLKETPCGN